MEKVNLRKIYPEIYQEDLYCELPKDIVELLKADNRREHAWKEKVRVHKAYYSLETHGIETRVLLKEPSAEKRYETRELTEMIYRAIGQLTGKQTKRVVEHLILGISQQQITAGEGGDPSVISSSIKRGAEKVKRTLKKNGM